APAVILIDLWGARSLSRLSQSREQPPPIPRRGVRPSDARTFRPRKLRAQGKPGARCTRSLARKQKSARASSPQVHRNIPAFPAQWFNGLYRALLGDEFVLSPSSAD